MSARAAAAVSVIMAISEAIRELGRVPSGHLYAQVMGHMSLETYQGVIDALKRAGLVEEKNSELIWLTKGEKENEEKSHTDAVDGI